jgi:hypothetical protein
MCSMCCKAANLYRNLYMQPKISSSSLKNIVYSFMMWYVWAKGLMVHEDFDEAFEPYIRGFACCT